MFEQIFYYLKYKLPKYFSLLFLFFPFTGSCFIEGDIEGSFRVRTTWLKPQSTDPSSFLFHGRADIKGEFYFSNEFQAKLLFLTANSYKKEWSLKESVKIYPSIKWLISEDLELRLGRNIYKNKFHQIVSLNDYEPYFYTFDGLFLEYSTKILNVNFWGASLPNRWVGTEQVQKFKYGFGFFLDIKSVSDYIDHFNAHVAYLDTSFFKGESKKISRYGLGLEGTINPMNLIYTLVAVGHGSGFRFKLEENMYHFQLSYFYPEFFNSKIFVGYHTDSSHYEPWLYDRHENAGLLDMFLWGNLTYYFLGLSSSVTDLVDIQVLFYDLSSTETGLIQMGYFGSLLDAGGKNSISVDHKNLGRELDVRLKTRFSKSFEVHLLTGIFIPHLKSQKLWTKKDFYNNIQLTGFYKF